MARIFLSYAREDAAIAASLARALERNSHRVWWDRHIGGGALFAVEIAAELKGAEVVIVLWSRTAEQSTWVQDEAAEGRDSGRLIPIALDDSKPPLGFRQFQSIDLSRWSGRGRIPKLTEIEAAIATILKGGTLARPTEPPKRRMAPFRNWTATVTAALAAIVLLMGIYALGSGRLSAAPPTTLAVMPFADFSPARDKAYFAEGVAEEIRTLLSDVKDVRVTGRSSTEMLGPTADYRQVREKLGATHLLEGSLRIEGEKMRLHIRLIQTKDGLQVWADEFDRELRDIFAVQDEIGAAVARRLRKTLWGNPLEHRSTRTAIQAFDLVLAAIAKWNQLEPRRSQYELALEAEKMLKRAIEIDPNYAPAWTALSRNVWMIINDHPEGAWGPSWQRNRKLLLRYAQRAVAIDPENADGQAWLGFVESDGEDPERGLARIERAIQLNPGDWRVWGLASRIFVRMCENRRALEAYRRIVALEPLEPGHQLDLMWSLYAFGRNAEADALRRKLVRVPTMAEEIAVTSALNRGDVSTALPMILKVDGSGSMRNLHAAHLYYALGVTDRAVALLPSDYRNSLGAYWKHDYRQSSGASGWLRHGYWNSARGFALTRALVKAGRQRELLQLLDQRFGSIQGFDRQLRCDSLSVAAPVLSALRAEGRQEEAERLVRLAERRARQSQAEHYGDEDVRAGYVEFLLVAGRRESALAALEQSIRPQAGAGRPAAFRLDLSDSVYDPIRAHPRFRQVERRIEAWRANELRELAAAGYPA